MIAVATGDKGAVMLSSEEKIRPIMACETLAPLGESGAAILGEMMTDQSYADGDQIMGEGSAADRIFVVVQGSVSVYLPGATSPVRQMGSGSILGEYGLFASRHRTTTVKADGDCVLLWLEYPRFKSFLHQFPEVLFHLLEATVQRLVELEERISEDLAGS